MDPRTTLEGANVQSIGESYFDSLNDKNTKLHIVTDKHATVEEIRTDVRGWYAGFMSCAATLGYNPNNLPVLESVSAFITKNFPDRAKVA